MPSGKSPATKVVREILGHLPDGSAIDIVRLYGDNGFEVRVIIFGAAPQPLTSLR